MRTRTRSCRACGRSAPEDCLLLCDTHTRAQMHTHHTCMHARKRTHTHTIHTCMHVHERTRSCRACGRSAPEDRLLLCDGCEAACHTHCMRPVLGRVPDGDWFCHGCEAQLQGSRMGEEEAVR